MEKCLKTKTLRSNKKSKKGGVSQRIKREIKSQKFEHRSTNPKHTREKRQKKEEKNP